MNIINIIKINNQYNCEIDPSISVGNSQWWFLNDKLHRSIEPAVITEFSKMWFWRGIKISKEIANSELSCEEILKIENMEIRQCAMEILGYEKFFHIAELLDKFTPLEFEKKYPIEKNPMYSLYLLNTKRNEEDEDIKILIMIDPSKNIKYFIRVSSIETNCKLAVAHSYQFETWEEFIENKIWV